jgi:hypothetical protein
MESKDVTRIELVPDPEHCVQTRARQDFAAAMSQLIAGDQSPDLKQRLELLRAFLEEADFGRLRRESEAHLAQGRKVKFIIDGPGGPGGWSVRMTAGDQ